MLAKEIATALKQGKRTFISGMARGSDIFAAEFVLEYHAQYASLKSMSSNSFIVRAT